MKQHKVFLVITVALALVILTTGTAMAHGNGRNTPPPDGQRGGWRGGATKGGGLLTGLPPASDAELTPAVLAAMEAGIMDEYHAYATYAAVIEQFGAVRPFTNIQSAEARHIDAWTTIFERYGVTVPDAPATVAAPDFADLSAACAAGAEAEIANFGLYDDMLETLQDFPDMVQVVTALRNASEQMHLPAFERCAAQ